jgi:hypothetical protein
MKIMLHKLVVGLTLIFKTMKKLFSRTSLIMQIFQDDKGNYSSNRFVGIMCALSLCVTMYHNQFTTEEFAPAPMLIQSVAALAFGALGLGAATRIFKKDKDQE